MEARGIPTESMCRDWIPRAAGSQAQPILHILLVVRDSKLVGIVTRANLLHALASVAAETKPGPASDTSIRERLVFGTHRALRAQGLRAHREPPESIGASAGSVGGASPNVRDILARRP